LNAAIKKVKQVNYSYKRSASSFIFLVHRCDIYSVLFFILARVAIRCNSELLRLVAACREQQKHMLIAIQQRFLG
jgi:hypothetical protein